MTFITRNWEAVLGCVDVIALTALYAGLGQYREITDFPSNYRLRHSVTDLAILSIVRLCVLLVLGSVPISFRQARRAALDVSCIALLCCSEAFCIVKLVLFRELENREKLILSITGLSLNTIQVIATIATHRYISKNLAYYLEKDESDYMELGDGSTLESENSDGKKSKGPASLKRLIARSKPESGLLVLGSIGLLVSALTNLAIPYYFGKVIAAVSDTQESTHSRKLELNTSVVTMVLVFIIGSIATFVRSWMYTLAGQRVVARLRRDLFLSIVRQEISFFDSTRTGELTNRLSSDTSVVQNSVTNSVPMFCRYVFQIAGSLVVLMIISWKLTLVMISIVPPVCIGTAFYAKAVQKLRKKFQDALAEASANAEETISGIRTIRVFNAERFSIASYAKEIRNSLEIGAKLASMGGAFVGIVQMAAFGAIVFVLWYGGQLVIKGEMDAGKLTSFLLYTLSVSSNVAFLLGLMTEVIQAVGASTRVFEILDRKPALRLEGGDLHPKNLMQGHIKLENIHFSYPSREGVEVIRGLSLDVPTGKVTAVVGQSGGGKSTLVGLLERLYDPSQGRITIDGYDLKTVTSAWHRSQIGLVSQEPILFNFSISENIRLGKPEASQAQVEQAAKLANAHDFIAAMDDGYDTVVGERGVKLSGGQKQRVAIARALLLEPRVLLLDEATSAQDAESEHLVKEAISRAMEGRTVLIVAHRLSTIRDATQVAVMKDGVFAQVGTHDELIKDTDGIYHQLVQKQLLHSHGSSLELSNQSEKSST